MDFALIETLGWWPQGGFLRLDRHLDRLERSAEHFGWRCDRQSVTELLLDQASGDGPLRVRLQFSANGVDEIAAVPFMPAAKDAVWKIAVARRAIDPDDTLLGHKTTRRDVYEAARREFTPAEADEVVLLNNRGEVCEGTITNIFARLAPDGPLLTPAIRCGLLPGVLREEALATGEVSEAVLSLDVLRNACELFVGNSLRGFIRAQLTGTIHS